MSKPKRIQRKRTKGWRMPEGAVYVGRPTRWGNPFRLWDGRTMPPDGYVEPSRAVESFRDYIEENDFEAEENSRGICVSGITSEQIRNALRGKDLACWCPLDQPCHADVLLEIANRGDQ